MPRTRKKSKRARKKKKNKLALKKRIIFSLFILFFIILFSICFIEICLRLFFPQNTNDVIIIDNYNYQRKPEWNYRVVDSWHKEFDNRFKTNSLGFYEKEIEEKKTTRILAIGDSFVEAATIPYEKTHLRVLENKIDEKCKNIEVINAGRSGTGTPQHYNILKGLLNSTDIRPDMIILYFYFNDVNDNLFNNNYIKAGDEYIREKSKVSMVKKVRLFFGAKSHFYVFLNYFNVAYQSRKGADKKDFNTLLLMKNAGEENKENKELIEEAWEKTFFFLDKTIDLLNKEDMPFVVVYMPSKEEVHEDDLEELIRIKQIDKEDIDVNIVGNELKEYFKEKDAIFINSHDFLKKSGRESRLYHIYDMHLNQYGNNVLGGFVANKLPLTGLLKCEKSTVIIT